MTIKEDGGGVGVKLEGNKPRPHFQSSKGVFEQASGVKFKRRRSGVGRGSIFFLDPQGLLSRQVLKGAKKAIWLRGRRADGSSTSARSCQVKFELAKADAKRITDTLRSNRFSLRGSNPAQPGCFRTAAQSRRWYPRAPLWILPDGTEISKEKSVFSFQPKPAQLWQRDKMR